MIKKFLQKAAAFVLCTVAFWLLHLMPLRHSCRACPDRSFGSLIWKKLRKAQSPLPKIRSKLCLRSCRDHRQR